MSNIEVASEAPPKERERRWLVYPENFPLALTLKAAGERIRQGYLTPRGSDPVARIRLKSPLNQPREEFGEMTVKYFGDSDDGCDEIETDLPIAKAKQMFAVCPGRLEKIRYKIGYTNDQRIDFDAFDGSSWGLYIAEIELKTFADAVDVPAWFGPEITGNKLLSNVAIAYDPAGAMAEAHRILYGSPEITVDERAAALRFCETCEDGEGYDVSKEMMKRLAKQGLVVHKGGGWYEGLPALNRLQREHEEGQWNVFRATDEAQQPAECACS